MVNIRKQNFIEKSNKVHNNRFDYSLVDYVNAHTKVKIVCPEHGIFEQVPDTHSRGTSCPYCKGGVKINQNEFIKRAIKKHGKKYDYSLVEYKKSSDKVTIICPEHGVFKQRPAEHLKYGCFKCGVNYRSNNKRLSHEDFIIKANKIHNNKYDYSESIYNGHKDKIDIICPHHGIFNQNTNSHLSGVGCPSCKESFGEKKIRAFLDENKIKYIKQKKFKDCKYKSLLPFDFYLPYYNLCVEYDGEQHFKVSFFTKNQKELNLIKRKDKIKTNFCNGFNGRPQLLRITYLDYKNIESILKNNIIHLS